MPPFLSPATPVTSATSFHLLIVWRTDSDYDSHMSQFDLRLLVGWGFFLAFIIIAIYAIVVKKLRNMATEDHLKEAPDFMLENIRGTLHQRREMSRELERKEQLNDEILRQIDIGIAILDGMKVVRSVNPRFLSLFNLAPDTVGKSIMSWKDQVPALFDFVRALQAHSTDTVTPTDITYRGAAIRLRSVQMQLETGGYLVLAEDVTEIEAAKRQLELKKRLEILGEMSAGIAHEFKTGLSTLMGYTQMILASGEQPGDTVEHAEHILDEARTMNLMVDRFLLFAKPLETSETAFSGKDLSEDIQRISENVKHDIDCDIDPDCTLTTDRVLLRNCLDNLIRNSIQHFSDETGKVRITAETQQDRTVITVVDNGPGMDEETLKKASIPFFTTRNDGTGLGLAICEKIITRLGGTLTIASAPGAGTTVTIAL